MVETYSKLPLEPWSYLWVWDRLRVCREAQLRKVGHDLADGAAKDDRPAAEEDGGSGENPNKPKTGCNCGTKPCGC